MAQTAHALSLALRAQVVGLDTLVPLRDGSLRQPINLDNAASTPALRPVVATVNRFLDWYSSVHRGAGFKSQVATRAYEEAREIVGAFFGARADEHVVIFGKNTTEAMNKLARRFRFGRDGVVLCSELEHHSNDLPWRRAATVDYIRTAERGELDKEHYRWLLRRYAGRVRLVAVSGGSNVTGALTPIYEFAELAHAAGAQIVVDGAQIAAHRAIDLRPLSDPTHLDYLAVSGHKLYAPFGCGALIGRADTFAVGEPDMVGGGTVQRVTNSEVIWAKGAGRDEAGTPNVVGAVALAAALTVLDELGLETIAEHEAALTAHALRGLGELPGVTLYGDPAPERAHERLGVIPFCVDGLDHGQVAARLSNEYGIAVRNGSFCAQPYLRRLLGLDQQELRCPAGDQDLAAQPLPGLVRVSFGLYNTLDEVDALIAALRDGCTGQGRLHTHDVQHAQDGVCLADYFSIRQQVQQAAAGTAWA